MLESKWKIPCTYHSMKIPMAVITDESYQLSYRIPERLQQGPVLYQLCCLQVQEIGGSTIPPDNSEKVYCSFSVLLISPGE